METKDPFYEPFIQLRSENIKDFPLRFYPILVTKLQFNDTQVYTIRIEFT